MVKADVLMGGDGGQTDRRIIHTGVSQVSQILFFLLTVTQIWYYLACGNSELACKKT